MANTLYAAFADATMAEKAAGALLDHGVRAEDLSLVSHESRYDLPTTTYQDTGMSSDASRFADEDSDVVEARDRSETVDTSKARTTKTTKAEDADSAEKAAKHGISTTTGADAGSGAITGTAVGLGVGAIAALASLLVPGIGLVIGGGALATALGGVAASAGAGAAAGAVVGYLKDQGMEEAVAQKYGETVSGGGSVMSVHVPSGDVDEAQARQILEKYGAMNVNAYATTTSHYMA